MERHEIMELLGQLRLAGMRAGYDELVAAGLLMALAGMASGCRIVGFG